MVSCWSQILLCYSTNAVAGKNKKSPSWNGEFESWNKWKRPDNLGWNLGLYRWAVLACRPWDGSTHREANFTHQDHGDWGGVSVPSTQLYTCTLSCYSALHSLFQALQSVGNTSSLVPLVLVPALWDCWRSFSLLTPGQSPEAPSQSGA